MEALLLTDSRPTLAAALLQLEVLFKPDVLSHRAADKIAIMVLTSIITLSMPVVCFRLWRSNKLWFFRLERRQGKGTYIVCHPLTTLVVWCSFTALLILIVCSLRYGFHSPRYQILSQVQAALTFVYWLAPPLGGFFFIFGTANAIPPLVIERPAWAKRPVSIIRSHWVSNGCAIFLPLLWTASMLTLTVLVLTNNNSVFEKAWQLRDEMLASDQPDLPMTDEQYDLYVSLWLSGTKSTDYLATLGTIWASVVSVEAVCVIIVGVRVVLLLWTRLKGLTHPAQTQLSTEAAKKKAKYVRESLIILALLYSLVFLSATILAIMMACTSHSLWARDITQAPKRFAITDLTMQWIVAVNGLGVTLLISNRCFAAAGAAVAESKVNRTDPTSAREAAKDWAQVAERVTQSERATQRESVNDWAQNVERRTLLLPFRETRIFSHSSNALDTTSTTLSLGSPVSGVRVDVEKDIALDEDSTT